MRIWDSILNKIILFQTRPNPSPTNICLSLSGVLRSSLSTNLKSRPFRSQRVTRKRGFAMTITRTLFEPKTDKCYAPSFVAINICLALIDGALALIAFLQVLYLLLLLLILEFNLISKVSSFFFSVELGDSSRWRCVCYCCWPLSFKSTLWIRNSRRWGVCL